jgi:hypothetical protein
VTDPNIMIHAYWGDTWVDPELRSHLPHLAQVTPDPEIIWSQESDQEVWCIQHVGVWDRDWMYVGKNLWCFRCESDATHFQLTWS